MKAEIVGTRVVMDGLHVPLISAQFDFYRHLPMFWEPLLREIQNVGFPIVSTFVCWDFHEVGPGDYDFSGRTDASRDLRRFLSLCKKYGLLVLLRPGPIIDDEWPTRGPAPDVCTLERSDPRFRARAAEWLRAVGSVIREEELTAGGAIALVQVDNEVFYPHCTEASATEADASYHIPYQVDQVLGDFAQWLKDTPLPSTVQVGSPLFDRVRAVTNGSAPAWTPDLATSTAEERTVAFRFVSDRIGEYHGWVTQQLRGEGVTVPIAANVKHGLAYFDWSTTAREVNITGCNNYFDDPRTPEEFMNLMWWYGLQRARLGYSWATEFWCGKWLELGQDTSVFYPRHYEYVVMLGIACGLRGANFFMFVERDDWHYSPLTAIAKPRPNLLQPFSRILPLMKELGDDQRLARIGLVWSGEEHQSFLSERHKDWTTVSATWWEDDQPKELRIWWDTLRRLVDEDWDFVIVDAADPLPADLEYLIYAGENPPSAELSVALARWMGQGGVLLVTSEAPVTVDSLSAMSDGRSVIATTPERLGRVLEEHQVTFFSRADRPGMWSSSYKGADYIALFVVNRTHRPLPVTVKVSSLFCAAVSECDSALEHIQPSESGGELAFDLDAYSVGVRLWKTSHAAAYPE